MLKPAHASGGKTQLAFLIPSWRDQVSQGGKALFMFQLGKGVGDHIQPSSLPCSLLIPFSAWGSTRVETGQGPGGRGRGRSWDMALEILWGTISPLQCYFKHVLSRTTLLSSQKTKKRTRRVQLS